MRSSSPAVLAAPPAVKTPAAVVEPIVLAPAALETRIPPAAPNRRTLVAALKVRAEVAAILTVLKSIVAPERTELTAKLAFLVASPELTVLVWTA